MEWNGTNYGMSSSDAIELSPPWVISNDLGFYNSNSGDSYYFRDSSTSDGTFDFSDGDSISLSGNLELATDVLSVYELIDNPYTNITWYDSNGSILHQTLFIYDR